MAPKLGSLAFWETPPAATPELLNQIDICGSAAVGLSMIDPIRSAFYSARYIRLARGAGDRQRLALALATEATQLAQTDKDRGRRSSELEQQAHALAERIGSPYALAYVRLMGAVADYFQGNWDGASDRTDQALAIFRERCTGVAWETATANIIGFSARTILGQWAANRRRLPGLLADARDRGDIYSSSGLRLLGAGYTLDLLEDEPERALRVLTSDLAYWQNTRHDFLSAMVLMAYVDVALYRGDPSLASPHIRENWESLSRSGLFRVAPSRVFCLFARARLHVGLAAGETNGSARDAYLKLAQRDAGRIRRECPAWSHGLADLIMGGVSSCLDRWDEAVVFHESSEARLGAARIVPYLAGARYRLADLGARDASRLREMAALWFQEEGIAQPARLARALSPEHWFRRSGPALG